MPKAKEEMKDCFKFKSEVCLDVAKAHKVDFKKESVGKPDVDHGKKGWDSAFGTKGDTWFTFEEAEETERKVSAEAGHDALLRLRDPSGHAGQAQGRQVGPSPATGLDQRRRPR